MKSSIKKELLIKIKYRAMTLLARREHSFLNLSDKLICIFPDESKQVYEIVLELKKKNLQSDLRFAEMITTVRIRKCYGQNRIKAELKSHKIDNDIIELSLTKCDADWVKIAKKALFKKYGLSSCDEFNDKIKRSNFLKYRGFTTEQITECFK
tara:strand:- start:88 stop:546 length:459 start_codon:yes stop_codon:yes gene_type:complete